MQEWINTMLTVEWLLGFSMALAFKRLGTAVVGRLVRRLEADEPLESQDRENT